MSTAPNPLTGSLFSPGSPSNNNMLLGWPGANVNPSSSVLPTPSPIATPPSGPSGNPGNLPNPASNLKDAIRNAGFLNVQQGQLRNQLIPMFANLMTGYAGPAANFFNTLMNLGSPYYQQQQQAGFTQGVDQGQNAAATAREELSSAGYGATPSGATAGMIGGMNIQNSMNLAEQFLQNLFQNENLQAQGATGLEQIASMFNPSPLFGNTTVSGSTQGPSAADTLNAIMSSFGFSSKGPGGSTISAGGGGGA